LEGDLLFFPSTVHKLQELDVEFNIRLCPALQKKITLPTPHFDPDVKSQEELPAQDYNGGRPDPFSPPYVANLHVGDLKDEGEDGAEFAILLNKYSVIPHHFLMITKDFKSQTSLLEPPELAHIYMLLDAGRRGNRPFFAFYNCGDNSGASQPHKHVQFIPIEEDGPPIERLARAVHLESPGKPFSLTTLPYANHVFRFTSPTSSTTSTPQSDVETALANIFFSLLDLAISTVRHDPDYPPGRLSYNVIMTLEHMHVIPRKHESYTLRDTGEKLAVNALGFAGMLLVKSEKELEAVTKEGWAPILKGVALKSVHDIQIAGTSLEAADGSSES